MSQFLVSETPLDGVKVLTCQSSIDLRGSFVKTYHKNYFSELGIGFTPAETFISSSQFGVVRGMHYQDSAYAHDKIVFCVTGKILDVIVDIRPASPQFNRPISIPLDSRTPHLIFIPKGYAHGFLSQSSETVLLYQTSTVHNPQNDKGILWSSIDFDWPVVNPILSVRDQSHPVINSL